MENARSESALQALKQRGFEIVEHRSEDGRVLIGIRFKDDSALVEIGQELWDLEAGRLTLLEISARRNSGK